VNDIKDLFDATQPNISQHLNILKYSGIVNDRQDKNLRCYFLKCDASAYSGDSGFRHRAHWALVGVRIRSTAICKSHQGIFRKSQKLCSWISSMPQVMN